jgi:uncharacterized membrane protein HdeD (DUF308 family)
MNDNPLHIGIEEVRRNWGWFLVLGILLILLGVIALCTSLLATLATVLVFGWLLTISGILEIVSSFWSRRWSGFFLHLLAGVFDIVVGLLIISHPAAIALSLTLLLAAFFIVGGVFRLVGAIVLRFPNWGWAVSSRCSWASFSGRNGPCPACGSSAFASVSVCSSGGSRG